MPFWIPVATASTAAGIFIAVDILASRRKRAAAARETAGQFRSAIAEALTQLEYVDAHARITEARERHDAAISGFRPLVNVEKLKHFDAAVKKLHRGRSELQPAPLKVLASLSSGKAVDYSDALTLREALNELQAFAEGN